MQRVMGAFLLTLFGSVVYAQDTLNFSIYPYHTVVESGLTHQKGAKLLEWMKS